MENLLFAYAVACSILCPLFGLYLLWVHCATSNPLILTASAIIVIAAVITSLGLCIAGFVTVMMEV